VIPGVLVAGLVVVAGARRNVAGGTASAHSDNSIELQPKPFVQPTPAQPLTVSEGAP
jgi:hypothetical protein